MPSAIASASAIVVRDIDFSFVVFGGRSRCDRAIR
jgi:hypothetical protein